MGEMCQVIDYLGTRAIAGLVDLGYIPPAESTFSNQDQYVCCSNPDNYQTRCQRKRFSNTNLISFDDPGTCNSADSSCNDPTG